VRQWDERAKKLHQLADLKHATQGLYFLKSGLLPKTGDIKGKGYGEYTSTSRAIGSNVL
jgi:hypothetical protein